MMQLNYRVNLVVCQKSKVQDWLDHFELYADEYTNHNIWYDLTDKNGLEAYLDVISDHGYTQRIIGIINYDLLWRRPELLKLKDFTLMLDESSLIQNYSAKRTKFVLKMQPANVILLSGTPTGGRYERLWTQMHLLGWPISRKLYEQTYVIWDYLEVPFSSYSIPVVRGYKNIARLKRKMREYGCVFMKTDECFDLPDQQDVMIRVDASSDYRKFMKNRYLQMSDGTELVGDTSLTARLYARQLCGQYSKSKLSAVQDLIESTDDRLIIFYNFTAEMEMLRKICGDRPGLNLQKCRRIIYYTLPESSELFEQSRKRIHRIGQEQKCFYYIPVCRGSIEEKILQALKMRRDYTDDLFKRDFK